MSSAEVSDSLKCRIFRAKVDLCLSASPPGFFHGYEGKSEGPYLICTQHILKTSQKLLNYPYYRYLQVGQALVHVDRKIKDKKFRFYWLWTKTALQLLIYFDDGKKKERKIYKNVQTPNCSSVQVFWLAPLRPAALAASWPGTILKMIIKVEMMMIL